MKNRKINLFLVLAIMLLTNLAKAQATVYVSSKNGAYGYCYGNANASNCAFNKCIENGGETPYVICSTQTKGYGAIAVGTSSNGIQVVGASAGYDNPKDASNRAIQECTNNGGKNISIDKTFIDN